MVRNNEVQRIPTQIYGLDKLLYGGLDIIKRPFTIVIRGGAGSESTLFGLQLLYSTNFEEYIGYNETSGDIVPTNKYYSGNIGAVKWKTGNETKTRGYNFTYNKLGWLTRADYQENGSSLSRFRTAYWYDKMGNFTSIERWGLQDGGGYDYIDDLEFTYTGNQVKSVEDNETDPTYNGAFNFVDGANGTTEYTYDQNGNMTKDLNKNISSISYNLLNLPTNITYSNGKSATYIYDANGKKLRTSYKASASATAVPTDYCGNMIYENGVLKQILVDGGYMTVTGTPFYFYYLQDHLGSNRVVVSPAGTATQVNHYYPFGGLFGESTGNTVQRFRYNGKEFDRTHGIDWYDYGARHMSPDVGRFTTIDPLAEKYYNISPYAYCENNSIGNIDEDGRSTVSRVIKTAWKVGKQIAKKGVSSLNQIETYTNAFSDLKDNINTLTDENASTWDKIKAVSIIASETLPISVSDIKDAKREMDVVKNAIHGNSKLSTKAQHAYDIMNKETEKVVKTGVSGGKILKNGKSARAETQVNKWNQDAHKDLYESKITHTEPAGNKSRKKILEYEKPRAQQLRENGELNEGKHIRP